MFSELSEINSRPKPFEFYSAKELWTDEHTSKKMLEFHLNKSVDLSSRSEDFIDRSVSWIVSHFDVGPQTSIIDFGCGPGLYTSLFAETTAKVVGVDFSSRSIKYAREYADQKGLAVSYYHDDYLEFDIDQKFDLITMIFCDYCALSPQQRKILLSRMCGLLKPEGRVLLDVYSVNLFDSKSEVATYEFNQLNGFWSANDYYGFVNTFKYGQEKLLLDKYTIIEQGRTRVVYNWMQYFSEESIRAEFEENGFVIEQIYSDVAGAVFCEKSHEMAIVARKSPVHRPLIK